jgi:hypothetical protein
LRTFMNIGAWDMDENHTKQNRKYKKLLHSINKTNYLLNILHIRNMIYL